MKRRNFLSILGAASVAPALPLPAAGYPVAASYIRYMYGLAVFQARTRASVSAVELVQKLRVAPAVAEAMMGEMKRKGVLAPVLNAAAGSMRAVSPAPQSRPDLLKVARHMVDRMAENTEAAVPDHGETAPSAYRQ